MVAIPPLVTIATTPLVASLTQISVQTQSTQQQTQTPQSRQWITTMPSEVSVLPMVSAGAH